VDLTYFHRIVRVHAAIYVGRRQVRERIGRVSAFQHGVPSNPIDDLGAILKK
jgi:hypothetical protein